MPLSDQEARRLEILRDYGVLDTASEPELDDIVSLARQICDTPTALISLIDESRQWFKARVGLDLAETPREHSFCAHALEGAELVCIPDATKDPRFAENPLVRGEPNIRFYTGVALVTPEGARLGTLCVLDQRTRTLTTEQEHALKVLSRHVMAHLELHRRLLAKERSESIQRELARRLETEHRRLVEAQAVAKVGSWDTDLITFKVNWSDQTHRIFRTNPASFKPTHQAFLDLVHPEDRAAVDAAFAGSFNAPGANTIVHRILLPGEVVKIVEERWQVFFDESGKPIRAVGTCSDITERKLVEEKLREQAALLDQANDAIMVRDLDHRILFWNKSAERIYGWTTEEAIGRRLTELTACDPAQLYQATSALLARGEWRGDLQHKHRNGSTLEIETRWTLLRDSSGAPKSILAINTDITERKTFEKQLLRAQRVESIGTLAGGIAHDLNNILAPIIAGTELLRRLEPNPKAHAIIDTVERNAHRGANLVKQVLSFARGLDGERVALQLRHVVREIESIIESTFPKNIFVESYLPSTLWQITGDPTQIHQILLNLCVNARDAMPDGGTLTLAADTRNPWRTRRFVHFDSGPPLNGA